MIRALLRKQFLELLSTYYLSGKSGKKRSIGAVVGLALLMVYAFGVFAVLFGMMGYMLCRPLVSAGVAWLYFALFGLIASVLGVFGSVFTTYSGLYEAKDNELLFSMPIPARKILLCRMVTIYAMTALFEWCVFLPAGIVYFVLCGVHPLGLVFFCLSVFLLPLLAMAISCFLGYLVALTASRMPGKNALKLLLTFLFLGVFYFFYFSAQRYLTAMIENSAAVADGIRSYAALFYAFGRAMTDGSILSFLFFAAISVGLFLVVYVVLSHQFIRIATRKKGTARVAYRETAVRRSSVFATLLRKEWSRFYGSAAYLLNCSLGVILLLAAAVLLPIFGGKMLTVFETMGMPALLAENLCFLLIAAVLMIASMCCITAPSISMEGRSMWVVRSLPVSTERVLLSKLMLHLLLVVPPAIVCGTEICILTGRSPAEGIMLILLLICGVVFQGVLGLLANLKFPLLDWTNETVPVKQGMSVMIALFGSWGMTLLLTVGYFLLCGILGQLLTAFVLLIPFVLLNVGLLLWLMRRGKHIFETL